MRKDLIYTRSVEGTREKYDQAIDILEYSLIMSGFFKVEEFNHVIASQLRIILCDTTKDSNFKVVDNSLIRRIEPNLKLYPVNKLVKIEHEGYEYEYIPDSVFNYNAPKINLSSWLNQVMLKMSLLGKIQAFTIQDYIKGYANKSGGAHVDKVLKEKNMIIEDQGYKLSHIATGFLRSIGRDNEPEILEKLKYLRKAFE